MLRNNNFNMIRLMAATQVLIVHGLNHLHFQGKWVELIKIFPGVPTFFFVSGVLIFASYDRILAQGGGLKKFWVHRVLRIYPALWVCIVTSIVLVYSAGYFHGQNISPLRFIVWLVGQASFVQFYNPEFMRGFGVGVLNGVLWTISVELQFYVLTPILYLILKRNMCLFAFLLGFSVLANLYLRLFYDWSNMWTKLMSVSCLPWIYMFMVGGLAHVHREQFKLRVQKVGPIGMLSLYVISMQFIGSYRENAQNSINPVSFVILTGLILWLAKAKIPLPEWVMQLIHKNDISYGIYLYHMPIVNLVIYTGLFHSAGFVQLIFVLLVPFFCALASWFLIERPSLCLKTKF